MVFFLEAFYGSCCRKREAKLLSCGDRDGSWGLDEWNVEGNVQSEGDYSDIHSKDGEGGSLESVAVV